MPAQQIPGGDEWDECEWDDDEDWSAPDERPGGEETPEEDPGLKRLARELKEEANLDQLIEELKSGYQYLDEEES